MCMSSHRAPPQPPHCVPPCRRAPHQQQRRGAAGLGALDDHHAVVSHALLNHLGARRGGCAWLWKAFGNWSCVLLLFLARSRGQPRPRAPESPPTLSASRPRTSSAVPRLAASKVSLPSMSANVSITVAPVARATRLGGGGGGGERRAGVSRGAAAGARSRAGWAAPPKPCTRSSSADKHECAQHAF